MTPCSASPPPMHTTALMTRKTKNKSAQFLTDISTHYVGLVGLKFSIDSLSHDVPLMILGIQMANNGVLIISVDELK